MPDDSPLSTIDTDSLDAETPTCARLIAAYLSLEGIDTVFGIPGGPIMGMFEAIAATTHVRTVLCRHEQGAVFAAYGHARCTGRPAVVVVTAGPGLTNTLSALASADCERVPILVLCGDVATSNVGHGAVQDSSALGVDVLAMARPVTAAAASAHSGRQALQLLRTLLRQAHCKRRPVVLKLPADVLFEPLPPSLPLPGNYRVARSAAFDAVAAQRALRDLRRARRIALLLGSGARDTPPDDLVALAERLGAAVASTPAAKGVFPEDHPLSLGVFGFAGSPLAQRCFTSGELEALVVLGSALGELSSDGWNPRLRPATLVQVDRDPAAIGTNYPADGVVGDVSAVVGHWLSALPRSTRANHVPRWLDKLVRETPRVVAPAAASSTSMPLRPERVFAELSEALAPNARVVCAIGNSMAYALHYLRLGRQQDFIINLGFACMGHAVSTAVGAQLADPSRPVVALIGDAAFAMGGFEVHTAVEVFREARHSRAPLFIVMNNGGNGMVDAGVRAQFGSDSPVDTGMYRRPLDICSVARGLGARVTRVTEPGAMGAALASHFANGHDVTVIEVHVARDATPPLGHRIDTLMSYSRTRAGS